MDGESGRKHTLKLLLMAREDSPSQNQRLPEHALSSGPSPRLIGGCLRTGRPVHYRRLTYDRYEYILSNPGPIFRFESIYYVCLK